jgi:GNAT superfamily N-acetyltransferase
MKVTFQPINTSAEVQELVSVIREIWPEVFTPIIGAEQVRYMLATYQSPEKIQEEIVAGANYFLLQMNEQIIGYTAYEETTERIYLSKLYLTPAVRGKGVSNQLFDWYETLATGKTLYLNVNKGNQQAIAVYEHRGFARVGERTVDIGEGFVMDDYIYEKRLFSDKKTNR